MGEMLVASELQHGARGIGKANSGVEAINPTFTLKEMGITKDESSQAQFLACLPDKTFEAVKSGTMTRAQTERKRRE